ncbi:SPOSA6832_02684 [Sporobolomyces salmonicolor]|uniref:Peptide hydrolase n=1 Tax=Sporidiobolus salmonicolor TaxID=5005 RepID=A0A0D6EN28_SPOSA|nr:SPOSA6832_02684 [Sporobolomyces salmonicolor]
MVECVYERSALGSEVAGDDFSKDETVVIAAHFDSRGSFGYPSAPGADDDGSGTALVLAVARHIWAHRLRFGRKIVFALYAGEEQGLLGSKWHAHELKHVRHEDVVMMLQVDMVGYRKLGEPLQLALPDLIGLPEASYFVGNVSNLYVPELVVGRTPACCSDHQSHVEQGYAATWIFERNGPLADPCYHNSCDLSTRPGYSFEQIRAHARVVMAVVLELGGYSFE